MFNNAGRDNLMHSVVAQDAVKSLFCPGRCSDINSTTYCCLLSRIHYWVIIVKRATFLWKCRFCGPNTCI